MRFGRGRRVLCPLLSSSSVWIAVCRMGTCRHLAAKYNKSEAVIKAVLDAYPDAAKAKTRVRCGRGRRVLCPPSLSPHVCVCLCAERGIAAVSH